MALTRIGGTLATVVVAVAVGGILANFAVENSLLVSSDWQLPALLSLGFVLTVLVVFAGIGSPWKRWKRTTYW